ncbi:MAG: polysaccharide biosynthesis protein [Blastocatellia bacterium]|nr:polysaccharide biosynthesis protein [Blastocatellia bacterium]
MSRLKNRYFFIFDLILIPIAAYLSYFVRLDGVDFESHWGGFFIFTSLACIVTPIIFWRFGIYTRYWRYASVEELSLLAAAVGVSSILCGISGGALRYAISGTTALPRSIPLIFPFLALSLLALPRLAARVSANGEYPRRRASDLNDPAIASVLIVGAGDAGAIMAREIRQNSKTGMHAVGFIDDDPLKKDVHIHGIPVIGKRLDIPRLVKEHHIRQVIIAMPTAPSSIIREVVHLARQAGVPTKIVPALHQLLDGSSGIGQLRDVQIEDLLRRKPVETDTAAVGELLRGKRVMVTGGGGSIGGELCRQAIRFQPRELIILGHGENSVFEIEQELRQTARKHGYTTEIRTVIADIRMPDRLDMVFDTHRPNIVFHAAAHKHVPLMECNPSEAITNNVLGTRNVVQASLAYDVERFVMISSDKAVNPTSVMGASKRAAELVVHQAATVSGKPFMAVRFGNVLGSRGSVILTFKKQIAQGGPVTITDPEMKRYFMTIPEAVQLVMQAGELGRGGEVFVLDMGDPVKIVDIARDLITLSGLEIGKDIEIAYTGIRPGEKLFEEIFTPDEQYERTRHEKIFIAGNASTLVPGHLNSVIQDMTEAVQSDDSDAVVALLQRLIPEFKRPKVGLAAMNVAS